MGVACTTALIGSLHNGRSTSLEIPTQTTPCCLMECDNVTQGPLIYPRGEPLETSTTPEASYQHGIGEGEGRDGMEILRRELGVKRGREIERV
ncbi:hypothetical protein Pcinc_003597 [Petrolisthes cinctipes]|uniref:Uncharacterized protein n=1 Tax=Petrolisthes cinctipes TaxID=88211 RepID=A0AAE1GIT9_PETCI|nr:hypothetical protein Pcinc_003597 [Petrolisthes cinctipes]